MQLTSKIGVLCQRHGLTALMYAARGGHKDIVKALLEKSADINAKNK